MNYHLFGDKYLEVPNEPEALVINYYLKRAGTGRRATVTIADRAGPAGREADADRPRRGSISVAVEHAGAGGRRTAAAERVRRADEVRAVAAGAAAQAAGLRRVGDYQVTLDVAGEKLTKTGRIRERIAR